MSRSHLLFEVSKGCAEGAREREVGLMSEVQIGGGEQQRMWRGVDMSPLKHRVWSGGAPGRGGNHIRGNSLMVKTAGMETGVVESYSRMDGDLIPSRQFSYHYLLKNDDS